MHSDHPYEGGLIRKSGRDVTGFCGKSTSENISSVTKATCKKSVFETKLYHILSYFINIRVFNRVLIMLSIDTKSVEINIY